MKTELSVTIDRDIEKVFDYTNNNVPNWSQTVISDEVIEEKNGGGAGTRFLIVTEERGKQMEFQGEVIQYDPPNVSHSILRGISFDIDVRYDFEAKGAKCTLVRQTSVVKPHGIFLKTMFFTMGWLMKPLGRRALEADFATLKRHLED